MDRKRRHESERSSAGPSSDNQSEGTIKKKPKVLDDCASSSEFDDYDFWLIKKPVSVSFSYNFFRNILLPLYSLCSIKNIE